MKMGPGNRLSRGCSILHPMVRGQCLLAGTCQLLGQGGDKHQRPQGQGSGLVTPLPVLGPQIAARSLLPTTVLIKSPLRLPVGDHTGRASHLPRDWARARGLAWFWQHKRVAATKGSGAKTRGWQTSGGRMATWEGAVPGLWLKAWTLQAPEDPSVSHSGDPPPMQGLAIMVFLHPLTKPFLTGCMTWG